MKIFEIIKAIFSFLFLSYYVLYEMIKGGFGGNSGHTAGLCEGFIILGAIISGAIQLFIFGIIALIYGII